MGIEYLTQMKTPTCVTYSNYNSRKTYTNRIYCFFKQVADCKFDGCFPSIYVHCNRWKDMLFLGIYSTCYSYRYIFFVLGFVFGDTFVSLVACFVLSCVLSLSKNITGTKVIYEEKGK